MRRLWPLLALASTFLACGLDVVGVEGESADDAGSRADGSPTADVAAPTVDAGVEADAGSDVDADLDGSRDAETGDRDAGDAGDAGAGDAGDAGATVTVTVTVTGPGTVTSGDGRITCPGTCSASVPLGSSVVLTASRTATVALREWGNGCIGRDPTCTVTVSTATTVTAAFSNVTQFVHSPSALYRVAVDTGAVTKVTDFKGSCASVTINDLAIDRNGNAYAADSQSDVHAVDLTNAMCKKVGSLGASCNGLTFAPDPVNVAVDVLYASCQSTLRRYDVVTNTPSVVGSLGTDNVSSGDLVFLPGQGVFISLVGTSSNDRLARVNLTTGVVSVVGTIGLLSVWGLGHRNGTLLGYAGGRIVFVDPATAATTDWNTNTGVSNPYGAATGP